MHITKEKIYSNKGLNIYWDDIISNYYLEEFKNIKFNII